MEIRFIKSWRGWQVGDKTSFPDGQAEFLVQQELAEKTQAVKKTPKKVAPEKVAPKKKTPKKKSVGRPKKDKMIRTAPKQK